MSKTVKYDMYVNTMNLSGNPLPLSKKLFFETINNYKEQVERTRESDKKFHDKNYPNDDMRDSEYSLDEMSVTTNEYDKYTETIFSFHDDGAAICFRQREAKDGWHWK